MRFGLAVIGICASVALAGCHEERSITMPDLVGLPQPEAQKELDRLGLRWRFGGSDRILTKSPKPLPPGVVIAPDPNEDPVVSQYPRAGERVAKAELVELETRCTMLRFRQSACY